MKQSGEGITAPAETSLDNRVAVTYIPVMLPDGVEIRSLRALGEFVHTSGDVILRLALERRELTADHPLDEIVRLPPPANGPFELNKNAEDSTRIPGLRRVNNKNFTYRIRATWRDSGPTPKSVNVYGFQISYAST